MFLNCEYIADSQYTQSNPEARMYIILLFRVYANIINILPKLKTPLTSLRAGYVSHGTAA